MVKQLNLSKISGIIALAFILAVLCIAYLPTSGVLGATRDLYWVGGSGNWSDTAHWSLASGGAGGEAVPDSDDNVTFDGSSDTGGSFTVTLDTTPNYCNNMDWSLIDQTAVFAKSSKDIYVAGSLTLSANLSITMVTTGSIYLSSTVVGKTITTNGASIASSIRFDGLGGAWTLQDAFDCTDYSVTLVNGSLDTNGQTLSCAYFITADGVNSLTLGASTVNCTQWSADNLDSISANLSTINVTGTYFKGNSLTYNDVSLVANAASTYITGANTFGDLTLSMSAASNVNLTFDSNQTIGGTFSASGTSGAFRLALKSSAAVSRKLSVETLGTLEYVDFYYIDVDGTSAPWDVSAITGSSADLGNNTDITFAHKAYWVGNSGYWNGTAEWSGTSGGAANANWTAMVIDATVGKVTDVYFDVNSFTLANQTVRFTVTPYLVYVHDMDWTGALNTPHFSGNLEGGIQVYGSITFIQNMSIDNYGGSFLTIVMRPDGTNETLTFGGNNNATFREFTIRGVSGGKVTLQDDMITDYCNLFVESGTFDLNGNDITCGSSGDFVIETANAKTVDIGNSVVTCSDWVVDDATLLTFDSTNSTINCIDTFGRFNGGGQTYNVVNMTGNSKTLSGNNTITTLTSSGASITVSGTNTITTATFSGGGAIISGACTFGTLNVTGTAVLNDTFNLGANQTITSVLNLDGNSSTNRLLVKSNTMGTARTLTVTGATVSGCSNVDFLDITMTPAVDFSEITGGSGNLGGNTGITFTAADDIYWVGDSGLWSSTSNWADASGGTGGSGRMPLPQDEAIFDAESFTVTNRTVTVDVPYVGSINAVNASNYGTIYSASTVNCYGDLHLGAIGFNTVSGLYLYGRDSPMVGCTTYNITGNVYLYPYGTTLTLSDDLYLTGTLYLRAGTFDCLAHNVIAGYFDSSTTTYVRVLSPDGAIILLNGTAAQAKWNVNATNFTLSANTATIILSNSTANAQTFTGGTGITNYYGLQITGVGAYTTTFTKANTFAYIYVDRVDAAKTLAGNVTLTVSTLSIPASGTTTVTITNTDFSKSGGYVVSDYLVISGSAASGGATFYAGANSTDNGGNSGWIFTDAATPLISTLGVSNLGTTTMTLNGSIDTLGGESGGWAYFEYGTSTEYGYETTHVEKSATGTFSADITGLNQGTSYHYRAVFTYSGGTVTGEDLEFTTSSISGAAVVSTGAATNVTSTSATLVGTIITLGDYSNGLAYFQYGMTSAYEKGATAITNMTSTGAYSIEVTGLISETTYHFRAVLYYGYGYYAYGEDATFSATDSNLIITISNGAVFTDYLNDGDILFVAESVNKYTGYFPDKDPSRYFQIQLLSTDGNTILAATPLWSYGDVPVSIHLNATEAATLTEGSAYIIREIGLFSGAPEPATYILTAADWKGSDLTNLDSWMVSTAYHINAYNGYPDTYGSTNALAVVPELGTILSDYGGTFFTGGIGNISSVRPDMFTQSRSHIIITTGTANNAYDKSTWVSGQDYIAGDVYTYENVAYVCILAATGETTDPSADATHWEKYTNWVSLQAYIENDAVFYDGVGYQCILTFSGSATNPSADSTHWLALSSPSWMAQIGSIFSGDANFFGGLFNVSGQLWIGYLILAVVILITLAGVSSGAGALGTMLLTLPLLLLGNYLRVIGIQITMVFAVLFIFMWVRQFWFKST